MQQNKVTRLTLGRGQVANFVPVGYGKVVGYEKWTLDGTVYDSYTVRFEDGRIGSGWTDHDIVKSDGSKLGPHPGTCVYRRPAPVRSEVIN